MAAPPAAKSAGKATVYFYSMPGWVSPGSPVWILEGNTLVAALEAGSYSLAYLSPGEHWLRTWNTTSPPENYQRDDLDLQAGHVYYVLLEKDGSMTLSSSDYNLSRLLEADPDLPQHEVSPQLAAIARKAASEFSATGGTAEPATAEAPSPPADTGRLLVASGTEIRLRLLENVNSFNSRSGEPILLEVEEDVAVGDEVVVPVGLSVEGIIQRVSRPRSAGIPGAVELEIYRLVLPSGDVVPLRGYAGSAGRPSGAAMTLGSIGGAGVDEAIGNADPYALGVTFLMFLALAAVRGHDAWLGAGTPVTASVRRDVLVTPAGRPAPEEPQPLSTETPVVASSMGPIVVPRSARVTGEWCVRLELPAAPSQIWITSAADLPPPRTVAASKVVPHGAWQEIRFPAWPVARFAVLGASEPATIPVLLEGTLADGSTFFAAVDATVRAESTR